MSVVPDWFLRFLTDNSFIPTREFVESLDPQSRVEAIVKFGVLSILDSFETFNVVTEDGLSNTELDVITEDGSGHTAFKVLVSSEV